jgi:GT2 family glycosyltransferase
MDARPRPITIVIATWNGLDYTRRCLDTLRQNTRHPGYAIRVVDNGSTDGTFEYLKTQPAISLSSNSSNLGFAKANNLAIRATPPDHDIVLLNNDTEIHQADWLTRLQSAACSAPDIGVAGCRLVRPDGTLLHAGAYMPLESFWGQQIGGGEKDVNQYDEDRDVEAVVFACVYLKREILDHVGLLDEDYFCYFEDSDYCLRAAARGYRTICCGAVTVVHHQNASAAVNGVNLSTYLQSARRVFLSKWEKKLRATRYSRQIAWHSVLNLPTGYSHSSRELVSALDRRGVHVSYQYVYGPGTAHPENEPDHSESLVVDTIRSRKLRRGSVQVVYAQGDVFGSNSGACKIGYTMLETDRIPAAWVRQANRMDEVWVPSQFNAATFRSSGVTRPIFVMPLGFDPDHFNPRIARRTLPGVYTFFSNFEWGERKAPELLLRAFNQEFRADEPVILLVKTSNLDPSLDVRHEVAQMQLDPRGGRIHFSLNQMTPTHQLGVLYRSADCFVLPTRGEGWGLPVIEAMACGLPVIATDWSAHCDFMTPQNAYPLPVERMVRAAAKCRYYDGFQWAEPSFADLRRLLRHVFQNREEARARGAEAAREAHAQWTWDHAARKIIARLDTIAKSVA